MPVSDPIPARPIRQRFVRAMRIVATASILLAGLALLLLARGQSPLHIHRLIAAALGIGLAVLLGTAVMMLFFLGDRGGRDAGAGAAPVESDEQ